MFIFPGGDHVGAVLAAAYVDTQWHSQLNTFGGPKYLILGQ